MADDEFALLFPTTNLIWQKYQLGDVFNSDALLGSQTKYKAWHMVVTPGTNMGRREVGCKIVLRHNYVNGLWVLIINGDIKAKHAEKIMDKQFAISFKYLGHIFDINVERSSSLKYAYSMRMDGHDVKEIREKADISIDEPTPEKVTIIDVRPGLSHGKPVTMYQLCCEVSPGEKIFVERRYSDFVLLNEMVRGYTGSHIRSTLPKLPGKVLNPFFDQKSPEFVNKRKDALQNYIKDLLTNSKVSLYTEVYCFLGLDPINGAPLDMDT